MRTLIKADQATLASIAIYLVNRKTSFRYEQSKGIIAYLPIEDTIYFLLTVGFNETDFEIMEVAK